MTDDVGMFASVIDKAAGAEDRAPETLNDAITSDDGEYMLILRGRLAPRIDGQLLLVTVISKSCASVMEPEAKLFVYTSRYKLEQPKVGDSIEPATGSYPLNEAGEDWKTGEPIAWYARDFKLRLGA